METPLSAKASLLQALTYPGHGLELIARIQRRTRHRIHLNKGSVYPALWELERDGLVQIRVGGASAGAGRPPRYYELTPAGVRAAADQREALLGLLDRAGSPVSPHTLREMRERLRRCAEVSAACRDLYRTGHAAGPKRP